MLHGFRIEENKHTNIHDVIKGKADVDIWEELKRKRLWVDFCKNPLCACMNSQTIKTLKKKENLAEKW